MLLGPDNLHDYRRRASDWIVSRPGSALWLDMGLGKTGATIDALWRLFSTFEARKVLVIAPKRVAQHTWPNELAKWEQARTLTWSVLDEKPDGGTVSSAIQTRFSGSEDIHLIGRDNVSRLVDVARDADAWPYDTLVIDEASSFKNPAAKRFKALRSILGATRRTVELTGTPASNGYHDLWAQMYLLDRGERLGTTVTAFRDRWFIARQIGNSVGREYKLRPEARSEIDTRLNDLCLSMRSEDYLTLPDRIDNVVSIDLPAPLRRQYDEFEREFMLALEDEDGPVTAATVAALSNKLRQFCNGTVYAPDGRWHQIHNLKLEALESVLAEAGGPVLCGYQFRSDAERIEKAFAGAKSVAEPGVIDAWDRREVPLLVAHPASAGHGLNLQRGGSTLAWFGLPWSLEDYQQFNKRLHRQGQDRPVICHHIVIADSIEDRVSAALRDKAVTQDSLLSAVRSGRAHTGAPA